MFIINCSEIINKYLDKYLTQLYSCVMIPEFINIGGPWKVLTLGVHLATMEEIKICFATTNHRKHLFSSFEKAVISLLESGCKTVFLDGSFIAAKPIPNDYDVCWDTEGVNTQILNPVFFDFANNRREQKKQYYGEFFPVHFLADGINFFIDFFQIDKHTGKAKGIIKVNLRDIEK